MALHEKMEKALNFQINRELYSAYLYLSMASYFDSINLSGFSSWMNIQVMEEQMHAMKFFHFIGERGGTAVLDTIEAPPSKWDSPLALFSQVLEHEQYVTSLINDLVTLSREVKDYATESFLKWFIDEQVEEEASADEVLQKLKLIGSDSSGIFYLDQELKTRQLGPTIVPTILGQPAP